MIGKPQRQVGKRADVDRNDIELIDPIALDRLAEHAESGVVDDVFDLCAGGSQGLGNSAAAVGLRKVAGNDDRCRPAGRRDLTGQRFQAIRTPRHQRHAMTLRCKNTRQLGAYARRCTGNQRHTLSHDSLLLKSITGNAPNGDDESIGL